MPKQRLSILYAAPGHALLSTSGPTRNILSLAEPLSQWADVTVAFRHLLEPVKTGAFKVMSIEAPASGSGEALASGSGGTSGRADDVAARGLNPLSHVAYLRVLRSFAQQWAGSFDVVLEKGWRLSGCLSAAFRAHGVPGILIENDVRHWHEPIRGVRARAKYLLHLAAQGVAGAASRRMPLIISETHELKTMLVEQRGIAEPQVAVIGLGVDHQRFCPRDQQEARRQLGIRRDACVLLYVGGLDTYHDLGPLLEAAASEVSPFEVHVVGDGVSRPRYKRLAERACVPVRFHGQQPHELVPLFIAASDLCLAPYNTAAFHDQRVPFSTLKIPEYMACARPVVSVPSGHIEDLIADRVSGFLVPNEASAWLAFLRELPVRSRLAEMGSEAARAVADVSWENTAAQYLDVSQRLVEKQSARQRVR
ncbi:glycosyltransferase [Candidatus Entotheonella palauensis]|uniref:Glycosyltransferase subfamily 4-like N-terminal domain-containing protein n=1 Tax=Candidatus Entotheonella gemina TaxID=1429439 RepID=W4MFZ4_9BACT|nr:glycosyltransferase [Candidatus Entotheonella palauensis]ETX08592.1 MAG: hypothetical protein ETSY2_04495 [Candidatus Entotheonella gemina]